ncbi:MAG: hypothetical protein FJY92_08900, partial [Candidatus Hydrogenedentes bacterium]|nr:hypothetical protein [Candidatus Hydrogenedentota bacterium]
IAAILCTPSCTPPVWLTQKYPEVLAVNHAGVRAKHGARRHACPNNPVYRAHCARIADELARAFGRAENVIGWQIDNEVNLWENYGCYCEVCVRLFRESLRARFGTIDALNEAWVTDLWSQTYQHFDQIPAPGPETWHHPSLLTAWVLFQGDSFAEYIAHQARVLRRHVSAPIGTDMMPVLAVSYERMHRELDIVQYNHYDTMDGLWRQVFWMDYARTFKQVPFWNTETSTCWNGSTLANGYRGPGFCRVNSWLPIALGGEANLYWLWRAHRSGQELMHGSVVSSHGRPLHIFREVQEVAEGYAAASDFITGTRVAPAKVAVHVSTRAWAHFEFQHMVKGFRYVEYLQDRVCRPLMDAHLRADFVDPASSLDGYGLVYSPFLPALDESGLRERLLAWIKAGGTWVAGPFTDIRTVDGAKFPHAPFGSLEEWAGVYCAYEIPGEPRDFSVRWCDGREIDGSLWYAGFEATRAAVLAWYTDGPLEGLAAVTETPVGKGRIVVLGTLPPVGEMQRLLLHLAARCEILPVCNASSNVLAVPREGDVQRGLIVMEIEDRPGRCILPEAAWDILSGAEYSGKIELAPCQVLVLQTEGHPATNGAARGHADGIELTSKHST